jgi:hypothetical protein
MPNLSGRAYVFMRWSSRHPVPDILGEIGWAFESTDRYGRFQCFFCGSTESRPLPGRAPQRVFWFEKCLSLPELMKAMSPAGDRPGFDEVKVFDVSDPHSELALQAINLLAAAPEEALTRVEPIEQTREVLTLYGVRSLAHARGFHAPFLWYNMLPGRSIPIRKLPVLLFQMRGALALKESASSPSEIEHHVRNIAHSDREVRSLGECLVFRTGTRYFVALDIAVDPSMSVGHGRAIAERVEQSIRMEVPKAAHVFVRVEPFEPAG